MIATAETTPAPRPYRGRFAPTPSGLLHLGSLYTALASYLDARCAGGRWLLRIDDLDVQRCQPGMADSILRQLEQHGLEWDEAPRYQSRYRELYEARLKQLRENAEVYACDCSRSDQASRLRIALDGPVYDGRCRERGLREAQHALRLRTPEGSLSFEDAIQGRVTREIGADIGDFVLRRRDGIIGYHLACAVDEAEQGISHVVRGADLLGSSFCQLLLMQTLGIRPPSYAHLPVLQDARQAKLSKQNHAPAIQALQAADNLWRCLQLLQQNPPEDLRGAAPAPLLNWAVAHWRLSRITARQALTLETPA
ncbi:glutamyl-Q tRNA(Asp) synthetase [Solimonas aquatica]|uniref:Glutamyl-Q tRNA(Asp) synthetase n=1 Tax=Solimonas aquatica TaxID=489703 RepID=A0A1H9I2F2_9GAMM|nr:tRNA glutamyl-Q(34) synthetase GluQRS [Solimonas aquatica]SEQ68756.1 glutamyl-Q tRNA(Asp) synthetase [Solimonas aquatica]